MIFTKQHRKKVWPLCTYECSHKEETDKREHCIIVSLLRTRWAQPIIYIIKKLFLSSVARYLFFKYHLFLTINTLLFISFLFFMIFVYLIFVIFVILQNYTKYLLTNILFEILLALNIIILCVWLWIVHLFFFIRSTSYLPSSVEII